MPTPLTTDQVREIAALAKLNPDEAQIETLRTELAAMLELSSTLKDADLDGAQPMTSPVESFNRLADDEPGQTMTAEQVAKLAPDSKDGFIRVPKVLD
ncbi:MAG: Asp-tRNA(Asn)/Glu-tRNA(Gln) amidotransferase GatCAB subunit C [Phycisphaera sp.]|nr:MAG: Asp-tRNA(Asn)/Glu-tRNA(Gln) amidotransferase GatCAB subunit C [Phycisphaera sp.]